VTTLPNPWSRAFPDFVPHLHRRQGFHSFPSVIGGFFHLPLIAMAMTTSL
jgi:hypothetical protein